eukprot:scaffold28286_cov60-Phaeocystis_antarctica.AAC.2
MACAVGRQGTLVESPRVRSAASRAGARVRRGAACVSPRKGANDAPFAPLTGKMPIRRRGRTPEFAAVCPAALNFGANRGAETAD